MSSSNQRPANRGFRSVLRCALSHYRQSPSLSAPEPNFRKDCSRELKKIKIAWAGLNYSTAKGVLILSPSKSSIPRLSS